MRPARVQRVFKFPFRTREDVRTDVRDEFDLHLELRTQELVEAGLTEPEARAQAWREFGDVEAGARVCISHDNRIERRRSIARFLGECRQDARLGIRLIARSPWQSGAAIVTLAVAIGGNTAIFSVANALLFKPLPVRAPHELAAVHAGESP
jgi:hypothetical protein